MKTTTCTCDECGSTTDDVDLATDCYQRILNLLADHDASVSGDEDFCSDRCLFHKLEERLKEAQEEAKKKKKKPR